MRRLTIIVLSVVAVVAIGGVLFVNSKRQGHTRPELDRMNAQMRQLYEDAQRAKADTEKLIGPIGDSDESTVEVIEAPLVNGKRNGVVKVYLKEPKRILIEEIPYVDGKKHGLMKGYDYETGKLDKIKPYVGGLIHGELKRYYPDSGKLQAVARFVKDEQHGLTKWFHPSGAVRLEHNWVNGMEHGKAVWKDADGRVVAQGMYKDDSPWEGTFQFPVLDDELNLAGYTIKKFEKGQEIE